VDEATIPAHHELRLQLLHGVQGDADHDEDRRPTQVHLLVRDAGDPGRGDGKDHGNEAQEAAPAKVTRFITAEGYAAVGRPGRMPGMKPENRLRLSVTSLVSNVIAFRSM